LREEAAPVEELTEGTRRLVRDLFDTMYAAEGIGLAAPQIGVSSRVLVVDVPRNAKNRRDVHALVNPVITEFGARTEKEVEGCLSIPGIEESVVRHARVVVEALTPEGKGITIEAGGLLARALQHEIDHLDGVLFVDRLSAFKRRLALKKWQKAQRRGSRP